MRTLAHRRRLRKSEGLERSEKWVTEEPLDESKPVSIAMIGAAAYRSLTRKKNVKTFSLTLSRIDQMLDSLSR